MIGGQASSREDLGTTEVGRPSTFRRFAWYGWPAAVAIIVIALIVEAAPLVLGTGENAIVNWSFFYVTFRFLLLPVACGLHLLGNSVLFLTRGSRRRGHRVVDLCSVLISAGYLALSYFYPLPFSKLFM
jgi:hypothetical protein